MIRRGALIALAGLVAAAVVALVLYAAGPDGYYADPEFSRWDHARRWGGAWIVFVASIGLGIASFVGLAARAAARRRASVPRSSP